MGAGSEGCVSLGVVVVLVELIRTDGRTEKTTRVRVSSESANKKGGRRLASETSPQVRVERNKINCATNNY